MNIPLPQSRAVGCVATLLSTFSLYGVASAVEFPSPIPPNGIVHNGGGPGQTLNLSTITAAATLAVPGLSTPRNFETVGQASQIVSLDLDGDRDTDVAVVCAVFRGATLTPVLQLFENVGKGTLKARTVLSLPAFTPLAMADLDADGRQDLIQVHSVGAVAARLDRWTQTDSFSFAARTLPLPFPASRVCVGNLDGKNQADLVIGDDLSGPAIHTYFSDGAGSYLAGSEYRTERTKRDVDNDGQVDFNSPVNVGACQIADINGDALQDVVVVNRITRRQQINGVGRIVQLGNIVQLVNRGQGLLAPYQLLADPASTPNLRAIDGELAVTDMDGDGDRDLVTMGRLNASKDLHEVLLVRNTGNGTYSPPHSSRTLAGLNGAGGLTVADVDRDGDIDIGVLLYGPLDGNLNDEATDHWVLLKNRGSGTFAAPTVQPTGAAVLGLAFAQIDRLGGLDALTASGDDHRLSVHYSRALRFPSPAVIPVNDPDARISGTEATDIAAGDFNQDGRPDVAVIGNQSALVGDGADSLILVRGPLATRQPTPVFLDLPENPDRILARPLAAGAATDIVVTHFGSSIGGTPDGISLRLDPGTPGAISRFLALPGTPADVAALKLNGDATVDLAVLRTYSAAESTARISLFTLSQTGQMTLVKNIALGDDNSFDWRLPQALTTADIDGDGRSDLIAVSQNVFSDQPTISVLRQGLGQNFTLVGETQTVPRRVSDIIAADFNRDGRPDLALTTVPAQTDADQQGSLEVFRNLGGGQLAAPVSYRVGTAPVRLQAGDLDGRPGIDLMVACDGSNEVTLLRNNGAGRFTSQERFLTGGSTDAVALVDMDADGDSDAAVANSNELNIPGKPGWNATVSFVLNRSVRTTASAARFGSPHSPQ